MNTKQTSPKRMRKRALLSSMAMLLVSAIAVTTATYAWFTSSTTAKVDTLTVNVSAASGLQLSATGAAGSWKSTLGLSDIQGNSDNLLVGTAFVPVSTTATANSGKITMYKGNFLDDKLTSTEITTTSGTSGDYMEFDLFAKVDNDTTLYLASGTQAADTLDSVKLSEALRVAFADNGAVANETQVSDWSANLISGSPDANAYLWEPNANGHQDGAVLNASDKVAATGNSVEKYKYRGLNSEFTTGIALTTVNTDTYSTVIDSANAIKTFPTSDKVGTDATYNNCQVCQLKKGVNKIRVYVWVEGQDADCINSVSGSDLSLNLNFAIPSSN